MLGGFIFMAAWRSRAVVDDDDLHVQHTVSLR